MDYDKITDKATEVGKSAKRAGWPLAVLLGVGFAVILAFAILNS